MTVGTDNSELNAGSTVGSQYYRGQKHNTVSLGSCTDFGLKLDP